ncbi:class D beta-lactamase [Arcobacter cloacae]|uniref:Beta-lactamase n=1 Tax=Arcobacter cloacae TaxID=1054034 RepID=A0A6M8NFT7_9BACT|nr:class D beta-lactamase [Arcobacter cloacae]QKF90165.1 putative class D beta-lactamase [Arcobacter cloacae]RXI42040.1 class D beta-lactamase [Arcobacter cloacae]
MHKKIKLIFILFLLFNSFLFAKDIEIENIFKNKQVDGTIVIESLNTKKISIYNDKRAEKLYSPASTFKIPNTLIALNEGVVTKDSVIVWDKKIREYESWNKDQTLLTAFKSSCVWCYQEFASKIGVEKYKKYLKELNYGNKKIGDEITRFWLDESLKITVFEQLSFLKRLYKNELPFKLEDMNTLKEIMIDEENEDYIIRAKTGWEGKYGWYVGYVETKDDVWFFAMNIDTKTKDDLPKRKAITLEALKIKGII